MKLHYYFDHPAYEGRSATCFGVRGRGALTMISCKKSFKYYTYLGIHDIVNLYCQINVIFKVNIIILPCDC